MYEEIFNAAESISCQYYDEEQCIYKIETEMNFSISLRWI